MTFHEFHPPILYIKKKSGLWSYVHAYPTFLNVICINNEERVQSNHIFTYKYFLIVIRQVVLKYFVCVNLLGSKTLDFLFHKLYSSCNAKFQNVSVVSFYQFNFPIFLRRLSKFSLLYHFYSYQSDGSCCYINILDHYYLLVVLTCFPYQSDSN